MQQTDRSTVSGDQSSPTGDQRGGDPNVDPAISVSNLKKTYESSDGDVHAVDDVSFDIQPGTAVGILGPNGAGKTTIIKSILSLVVPTSGSVQVDGKNVYQNSKQTFQRVGAMFEGARNTYWRLTVRENLEMFSVIGGHDYRDRGDRIDELLEQFNLEEKEDTVVRELSRGQKQKVTLSCTMARDADVVFLDEPTLGLDVESSLTLQRELRNLVDDDGTTVVLSSHDMDVVQTVCDRVIILNNGEILVDDDIDSLLEVFNTQTYEITVAESLEQEFRDQLRTEYGATEFERNYDKTRFDVNVSGDKFYRLVDDLRAADLTIQDFDSIEPDLEDIFLHVTDETAGETEQ